MEAMWARRTGFLRRAFQARRVLRHVVGERIDGTRAAARSGGHGSSLGLGCLWAPTRRTPRLLYKTESFTAVSVGKVRCWYGTGKIDYLVLSPSTIARLHEV